jgi:phosphoribosylformylglycinamidine cyclo-ligase
MCGGETSDAGDIVSTLFVDSTFYSRLKRESVVDCGNIKPGDAIVGLASFGQAVYESEYNSGMGSNGLTAARHILLSGIYKDKYPETFSSTIERNLVYGGKYKTDDILPGTNLTIGRALLSPTRTYAPIVKEVLNEHFLNVRGIIHCTGGGQIKCKNFGKNLHYIKNNLFETPPLFKLIRESGLISEKEMYQDFNMGHRLEIYCDEKIASNIVEIAGKYKVEAKIIGRVQKLEQSYGENRVTIIDRGRNYEF